MQSVSVFAQVSIFAAVLSISPAFAQTQDIGEERKTRAESEARYSETSLKFDILEAQLQTLRKKMQLRSKMKAEQTKEWNDHYERVKQQIEAWDDFVDSYEAR